MAPKLALVDLAATGAAEVATSRVARALMNLLIAGAAVVAAGALGTTLMNGVAAGAAVVAAGAGEDGLFSDVFNAWFLIHRLPFGYP